MQRAIPIYNDESKEFFSTRVKPMMSGEESNAVLTGALSFNTVIPLVTLSQPIDPADPEKIRTDETLDAAVTLGNIWAYVPGFDVVKFRMDNIPFSTAALEYPDYPNSLRFKGKLKSPLPDNKGWVEFQIDGFADLYNGTVYLEAEVSDDQGVEKMSAIQLYGYDVIAHRIPI